MQTEETSPVKDRHILVAVDLTEHSKRAVLYVAEILGGSPGFQVTLLSIIPEPEKDFFDSRDAESAWTREQAARTADALEQYRQVLIQAGFPEHKVHARSCVGETKELAESILEAQRSMHSCTVVVGRHHQSKTEEFLLGSISGRLIREAKNCAIWVVE